MISWVVIGCSVGGIVGVEPLHMSFVLPLFHPVIFMLVPDSISFK